MKTYRFVFIFSEESYLSPCMRVLVAEDDILVANKVQSSLANRGYTVIGPARKGKEAIELSQEEMPDMAILDWELADDVTGLEIAASLNSKADIPIIFITGRLEEEVREKAMAQNAFAFLNKPFNERNLMNAIDLAIKAFGEKRFLSTGLGDADEPNKAKPKSHIFIKKKGKYIKVVVAHILFIEAQRHDVVLYTTNGQVLVNTNISSILEELNNPKMVKVHRSYAVNTEHVDSFDEANIHISNKAIPLSKSHRKEFMDGLDLV